MTIDLDRVDEFEQRFGTVAAFRHAHEFMVDCFGKVRRTLPAVADHGLAIARKFQKGEVGRDQLVQARVACWKYLGERSASTDVTTPEYCAIRAAICFLYDGPTEGGDAIDLVSLFLDFMDSFEPIDGAAALLAEHFPP